MNTATPQGHFGAGDYIHYWNVVFISKPLENWWDIFNPEKYRHVMAYGYAASLNCWVIVDPLESVTSISVLSNADFDYWLGNLVIQDVEIYQIKRRIPIKMHKNRIFQSCSTIIARMIGLNRSAWRPCDLVKILAEENAIRKHPKDEPESKAT